MTDPKIDLGQMAEGNQSPKASDLGGSTGIVGPSTPGQVVLHNPDLVWLEATQGLQNNLIRTLRDYKMTRAANRAVAVQRERMITEVSEQYVTYLREEARIASTAALDARGSLLRQELAKLKGQLFTELADVTGAAVVDIERIAQTHAAKLTSPAIREAYAKFVMAKILDLLENPA